MRWLAATLMAGLLAGCAAPAEEPENSLIGLCPQWMQATGEQVGGLRMHANESVERELGPADATLRGMPLDLFRVHIKAFESDGLVRLRATDAEGQRLSIRDYRLDAPQIVPVVVLRDAATGHDFDVTLSALLEDDAPAPLPAQLNLTLEGSTAYIEYVVTYHYKVCGI